MDRVGKHIFSSSRGDRGRSFRRRDIGCRDPVFELSGRRLLVQKGAQTVYLIFGQHCARTANRVKGCESTVDRKADQASQ